MDELLRCGASAEAVAAGLGLQLCYVLERAKLVRLDNTGQGFDVTVPMFAKHEEHIGSVMAEGGYPAIRGRMLVDARGRPWRPRAVYSRVA